MRDRLYLSWRYLCHHRWTSAVLVASLTLVLYLPAALQAIVSGAEKHFRSRARSTPLLVGPKGSALELVLAGGYFDKPAENTMRMREWKRVQAMDLGRSFPLHHRFTTRGGFQIVATKPGYLDYRQLEFESGRLWQIHGQCVLGSKAARELGAKLGDRIPVSGDATFVLTSAPLRLQVTGVLEPTETPDDQAVFVDLETAWIMEGLGHGHQSGAKHGSAEAEPFTDITPGNVKQFHFHGDSRSFPISSVLVVPDNRRAETLLLAKYLGQDESAQIIKPADVMDRLLQRVLMVRSYLIAIVAIVALVTLLMIGLVIVLSIRLRRAELVTMSKIGCSRGAMAMILGGQVAIVLTLSLGLALGLTLATRHLGPELVRLAIL